MTRNSGVMIQHDHVLPARVCAWQRSGDNSHAYVLIGATPQQWIYEVIGSAWGETDLTVIGEDSGTMPAATLDQITQVDGVRQAAEWSAGDGSSVDRPPRSRAARSWTATRERVLLGRDLVELLNELCQCDKAPLAHRPCATTGRRFGPF